MSTTTSELLRFFTIVPSGMRILISLPFFPDFEFDDPGYPFEAMYFFLYLKSCRVLKFESPISTMFPPRPPLPPSGPPLGMNFSLLNEIDPAPPLPA